MGLISEELAEEFKKQFTCLEENTEKEVTRIDENGKEITKHRSYILNLLIAEDSWQAHYQNLFNNLSERIHRIKCKFGHNDKKCETCVIKYKFCDCFLEYTHFKDDLIEYKCSCCKKKSSTQVRQNVKRTIF